MAKRAKKSSALLTSLFGQPEYYECRQPWPENCFVQCGEKGLVFSNKKCPGTNIKNLVEAISESIEGSDEKLEKQIKENYVTAFFEAFPSSPNTFIRGEGKDIETAEENAFKQYLKISSCSCHEFEARGYKNGYGICKYCGMGASQVIEPTEKCFICNVPTWYGHDIHNRFYCENHYCLIPENDKTEFDKLMDSILDSEHKPKTEDSNPSD